MKSRFGTLTSAAPCKLAPWTEPLCLAGAVLWDSCYRPPLDRSKAARALHRAALKTNCQTDSGSVRHLSNVRARATFQSSRSGTKRPPRGGDGGLEDRPRSPWLLVPAQAASQPAPAPARRWLPIYPIPAADAASPRPPAKSRRRPQRSCKAGGADLLHDIGPISMLSPPKYPGAWIPRGMITPHTVPAPFAASSPIGQHQRHRPS